MPEFYNQSINNGIRGSKNILSNYVIIFQGDSQEKKFEVLEFFSHSDDAATIVLHIIYIFEQLQRRIIKGTFLSNLVEIGPVDYNNNNKDFIYRGCIVGHAQSSLWASVTNIYI